MAGTPTASIACAECGAELPGAAKFCLECGTPVLAGPERESRRTVTLLFTDVTGSTAMGEQLDPEAYRGVMGRYFAIARAAVERHGGTVEKFVGDAVLAVFGIPDIHEDDALRAVRAARELNDAVAELSERLVAGHGVRFAIRTGVNTGSVVAGSARAGGSFATGDAVNTAARLEQAAGDGEILLGGTTYALVRDAVDAVAVEPVRAKGKAEPVPAYRLDAVLDGDRGRRRRGDTALVGRDRENAVLDDAFEQTLAYGSSHLVSVIGPPGIGKSRLASEFLTRVGARARVARGRCLSYGQGITYWPLVQALRDALDLSGTESAEITRHALAEALGRARDRDEAIEPLLSLLGKGGAPVGGERIFWCLRRLVEELCTQRPLVLSLDDLHWAEPTLLEVVQRMRAELANLPLLLLCQARPELLELYPGWDRDAVASASIRLDPLSIAETSLSVAGLLGSDPPEGLAVAVADWSGGNPLFIEEIVAHLVDSSVLVHESPGRWLVTSPLQRAEPPPTVTALLASRLDLLPFAERDLLERVSVIGLEFETAQAEMLVEPPLIPRLTELFAGLAGRDLIRPLRSKRGEAWAFKHVLVRDAAYDGMAKSLRSELHERFADALTKREDGGDELAGFVAHHLEQAARYRRELAGRDPEADALVDRAVEALLVAAEHARNREWPGSHLAHLERAWKLGTSDSVLTRRILALVMVHQWHEAQIDRFAETLDAFEAFLDASASDVDRSFLRTMRSAHAMETGGVDPAEVSRSAEELVALGRVSGDVAAVVRGLRVKSVCSATMALWNDAAANSDEIIRIGSPADARDARVIRALAKLLGQGTLRGYRRDLCDEIFGADPDHDRFTIGIVDSLVAAAERSPEAGDLITQTVVQAEDLHSAGKVTQPTAPLLIDAFAMSRDLDGAIAYAQRVNDVYREAGASAFASTYILQQAMCMLERGDSTELVLPLVDEAETYTAAYDALSVSYLHACRAILAVRAGAQAIATGLAHESLGVADRTDQVWQRADLRRYLSAVPRAAGDHAHEREMLVEAAEMYARKEIRSYDAEIGVRLAELDELEA